MIFMEVCSSIVVFVPLLLCTSFSSTLFFLFLSLKGAATNGRGILEAVYPAFSGCAPLHIVPYALRYAPSSDCTHTVESPSQFVMKLLCQMSHSLLVYLPAPFLRADTTPAGEEAVKEKIDDVVRHVRAMVCDALKTHSLSVDLTTKRKFLKFREEEKMEKKKV